MARARRSGLSRTEPVGHLLSTFRKGTEEAKWDDVPYDAPPMASSNEDDISDSSSSGRGRRGDIQTTNFTRQPSPGLPHRAVHFPSVNGRTTRSKRPAASGAGPSEPPPSKKRRTSSSSADPLADTSEHYISSPPAGNLSRRLRVAYGRKAEKKAEKQTTGNPASMNP